MPFSLSGLPTTFSDEINWYGVTSWHQRFNDCYILGSTLSTKDHTSGSALNKIFTPELFIDAGLCAALGNGNNTGTDTIILGITASPFNGLTLGGQAARGYTLFIKYGNEGSNATAFVPNDNIRERPSTYSLGGFTYLGITRAGFTFIGRRWDAISIGLRDFGSAGSVGLTGCYTYYLINANPANYGELIWRVQFSFGGTGGKLYDGPPLLWDGFSAYIDVNRYGGDAVNGVSYWMNNDGCMAGVSYYGQNGELPRYSSVNTATPQYLSDGFNDPRPVSIDYVQ